MKCPRCQQENPTQAKFCLECATPLAVRCANCGTQLPSGAKFCFECATPVSAAVSPSRFASPEIYTPKHLAERIINSKAALEGERKQVTVLFADLKGSMELLAERDPEEARKLLDPVLERMMEAVHRFEGTVNQVMGDGIMALFGAPIAHEDHAVRACYAALRMQDTVKRYAEDARRAHGVNVMIRIGLNSGEVVVRAIGSDLHMDYTAVGETTHLAARMEQLASPGSILLTPSTLGLVEGFVQVTSRGPVPVKGMAASIEIFELAGASAVRSRLHAAASRGLTRFVGRDTEIELLRQALARAGDGHGQVVAVVGEPGVGKSRLVWEFTHSHRSQAWLVLETASVSYGKATTYFPVIELLRGYFGIEPRDDERKMREKVTGKLLSLDRALEPALPVFLSLLDMPVEDAEWTKLDPSQRRRQTLDAVKRLLLRESQVQPVLLVVEDLHWIDSETQAWLDVLVESLPTARLLLLVNYRPEYGHGWGSKTCYQQVRLDALPTDSAEELLQTLLGTGAGLANLRRLLIDRTQGNPFFLEESVRALVETGTLSGERGAYWLARPIQSLQVPATAQAILAARIDRLEPRDKRLLQAASVVGKDVPFPLLDAIAEEPEERLRESLTRLQAAEFLYEARLFPELEYTFRHALTHEVAYGGLLQERRCALHERVLEALEQKSHDQKSEYVEQLAHHATRAQLWDRGARYLYQAGEHAFAQGRYHAAAKFCETAMGALDRLGDAADRVLKLDACLELWSARTSFGQYDGFRELAETAEALARTLGDGPRLAQVQLRRAQSVAFTGAVSGTLTSAIDQAREAFERAGLDDVRTRSYARFIVGHAVFELGRITDAVSEFTAGLALFERMDRHGRDAGVALPIYVTLAAWRSEAYAALGDFPAAVTSANDALRMATDIQHGSSLATANMFLGMVYVTHGEMALARPVLQRGLAIATAHDLHLGTIRAAAHLAYAVVMLGERDRGLELLARARERSAAAFTAPHVTGYGTVTASTYLAANRPTDARLAIQQGLAAAAERNARGYRASLLRLEAALLATEDSVAAGERLREAMVLAAELRMRPEVAHCHLGLGTLYRPRGDQAKAKEHLTTATTMYRDMGMTYWLEKAEAEMRELG